MARNGPPKRALGNTKGSSRRLVPRIQPAAEVPEPRDLLGGERNTPAAAVGEHLGQSVVEGEKHTTLPFKVDTFYLDGGSVPSPKQVRVRRSYEEDERRQVADTRRRGACESCRASKTKCLHEASKITTEAYQTQSQSHELFALGLSTTSLTVNEDEHKQVMEGKIAALDDKLVRAQEDPLQPKNGANNDRGAGNASVVAPRSPHETTVSKELQQNYAVEVHYSQARQIKPLGFQQAMGSFKLNNAQKKKPSARRQPTKSVLKHTANATLGRKLIDASKATADLPPIILQQRPVEGAVSSTPAKQLQHKSFAASGPGLPGMVRARCAASSNNGQMGCKALQQSIRRHQGAPKVSCLGLGTRSNSNCSEKDTYAMATAESVLSHGRSPSLFSESSSSSHQRFVQLSDIECPRSDGRTTPGSYVALNGVDRDNSEDMPDSFVKYLEEDWDELTEVSTSTATDYTTSRSGIKSFSGSASKVLLFEPTWEEDLSSSMETDP